MISLPNTGGKLVTADSTGTLINVGDRVRFRGQVYTIKKFGPFEDHYGVRTIIFTEAAHCNETPHECNVDKVDASSH